MERNWTFGQKVGAGFAGCVLLTTSLGAVAFNALSSVVAEKDQVIDVYGENIIEAASLEAAAAEKSAALRGFLLSNREEHRQLIGERRGAFQSALERLRPRVKTEDA